MDTIFDVLSRPDGGPRGRRRGEVDPGPRRGGSGGPGVAPGSRRDAPPGLVPRVLRCAGPADIGPLHAGVGLAGPAEWTPRRIGDAAGRRNGPRRGRSTGRDFRAARPRHDRGDVIRRAPVSRDGPGWNRDRALAHDDGSNRAPSPSTWLAAAWSALMMLFLAVPMVGRFALWRLARGARPIEEGEWNVLLGDLSARIGLSRRVTLLRSRHALMPMTWGWLRPVVLLPIDADSWTVERRRDVLLHELSPCQATGLPDPGPRPGGLCVVLVQPARLDRGASPAHRARAPPATIWCCSPVPGRPITPRTSWTSPGRSRSRHRHSFAALAMARPSHLEGRLISILDRGCPRRGLTRRRSCSA